VNDFFGGDITNVVVANDTESREVVAPGDAEEKTEAVVEEEAATEESKEEVVVEEKKEESKSTKKKKKNRGKGISSSSRSGLVFPVGRVKRYLRGRQDYYTRISETAPIYLAAVLEYLTAEILTTAGDAAKHSKLRRIKPRHINVGIRNDKDMNDLLDGCTIGQGGHVAAELPAILIKPKNKAKSKAKSKTTSKTSSKSPWVAVPVSRWNATAETSEEVATAVTAVTEPESAKSDLLDGLELPSEPVVAADDDKTENTDQQ
jgi:histone H2A